MPGVHDQMVDNVEPISEPTEADFEKRKRELEKLMGDLKMGSENERLVLEKLLEAINER